MCPNLFDRELGVCDPGYNFYNCKNGFIGCCSVGACDLDGCPEEDQQTTQADLTTTTTNTPTMSSFTLPTDTRTIDVSNYSDKSSTSTTADTSTPLLGTATQTTKASSSLPYPMASLLSSPLSSSFLQSTAPTIPPDTTTTQSSTRESTRLSTAAIAGISAGSTVAGILILTIVSLLIRRRYIAKRMASMPSSSPFAGQSQGAEKFMMDHPSWQGQPQPGQVSTPRGISELP
ncbi:hypothetical protein F4776DRAFT_578835 [Hypoxylon sp. NC0597]|nr:hypothetical protein F4776DRAFT_578835 [Hypoxylon sp. NC0597]